MSIIKIKAGMNSPKGAATEFSRSEKNETPGFLAARAIFSTVAPIHRM